MPPRTAVKTRAANASRTTYGGPARAYIRKDGELQPTVVQLPGRPANEYTAKARRLAIDSAASGRLTLAADLWRASLTEFGTSNGIASTIAHGILGLPLNLQGDCEQITALLDGDGTPGDFGTMFPESEAAQVFLDGIGLGVGLGQLIEPEHREICERNTPRMVHWDPRWLRQDTWSRRWYLQCYPGGEVEIVPGDGEWVLFQPYGNVEPWKKAPWIFATLAFIFARDATFDRQRHSEVCSPARVMRADKPTTRQSREKTKKFLDAMQRDNRFVLPEGYIYEVIESTGKIADIYQAIIDWAHKEWAIGWTGQTVTTDGGKGFIVEGTIHQRIARDKLRFYAATWFRCLREQALVKYAWENFGSVHPPTGGYNVDPPEDIGAKGTARAQWAQGIIQISAAAKEVGGFIDPAWVVEDAQKQGVRIILPETPNLEDEGTEADLPSPGYAERVAAMLNEEPAQERCRHGNPNSCRDCGVRREDERVTGQDGSISWRIVWVPRESKTASDGTAGTRLPLGVAAAEALIKGDEGRHDMGLPPFGDDRGNDTVVEIKNAGDATS